MPVTMNVHVHVHAETAVSVRLHPQEDRAVLSLGDAPGCPTLVLFADQAELVVLRDALTAAVADLAAARRELAAHRNENDSPPDGVRGSAA